jgi:plastocyanin
MKRTPLFFLSLFILIFSSAAWAGGVVSGVVLYQGIPPLFSKKTNTVDVAVCGNESVSENLIIGKKGEIKNAVVYIRGPVSGGKSFAAGEDFVIDQKGCRFDPHVVIVPVGAPLQVLDSDGILHDFHTVARSNPEIHKSSSSRMTFTFRSPEIVEASCDLHPGMKAWIVVAESPYYAVTDAEGRFQLTDVPAGDYTLSVWQEELGTHSRRLHVAEGSETKVELKLTKE